MSKPKNSYFYSDDVDLLNRLFDELVYSGRRVGRVRGGIVQFALPKPKPTKAEIAKAKAEKIAKEGKEKNKRPEQKSKRERWMGDV